MERINASIAIPAHNEQQTIGQCIEALLRTDDFFIPEIVVVCNGCTDGTASVVRGFQPRVKLIETPIASKPQALNLADPMLTLFPRFYIDADIEISAESIARIAKVLTEGPFLAAGPRIKLDLTGSSWAVRAFYEIDSRLPSFTEGIGGSGVYALSEVGRRRFDRFPDVISDDGFVRCLFKPSERITVENAYSKVKAPKGLAGLIAIKSRAHLGNYQLEALYPHLWQNRGRSNWPMLLRLLPKIPIWDKLLIYGLVKLLARIKALYQLRTSRLSWARDESSRTS